MFPADVIDRAKQILLVLQSRAVTFNVSSVELPDNKSQILLGKLKHLKGLSYSNARMAISALAKEYSLHADQNSIIDFNKNDSSKLNIESKDDEKGLREDLGLNLLSESVRTISVDIVEQKDNSNHTQNSSFSLIIEMQRNLMKKRKKSEGNTQQTN